MRDLPDSLQLNRAWPALSARTPRRDTLLSFLESTAMHLFDNLDSGNGYKVRLLLAQLGRPYEWTISTSTRARRARPSF